MGKRHRERRAAEKRLARWYGYKENEHGELVKTVTKAEARRRFLRLMVAEKSIIQAATEKAKEDICAIEDERVLEVIRKAARHDRQVRYR